MSRLVRRLCVMAVLGALPLLTQAQTDDVRSLIKQGIALYDEGQLDQAVAKYQQALKLDPGSNYAKTELAMTYEGLDRHAEAAALCQQVISSPGFKAEPSVYITYGNALDGMRKPREAVKVYQQGIKKFPTDNQLYFNLGVALSGPQPAEAIEALQQSAWLNPRHASSHLYLALLTADGGNRVPAILELGRFLVLEPQGARATSYLPRFDRLMKGGAEKTGENSITISVSRQTLDAAKKGKGTDNFAQADMALSMLAALDYDDKNKDKTPAARMAEKLNDLIASLGEQDRGRGFVWEYYVPYYLEMKRRDFVPAFTYLIQSAHTDQPEVQQWLAAHPVEVEVFREWSKNYAWPK